jgi:peptidoglycan/LPS O-acetylase OafA/YrhL
MTVSTRPRLDVLTSVRLPAILVIAIFHLWGFNGLTWAPKWVGDLASLGYMAVTFFFVLSGFVLTYSYAEGEINLQRFWWTRLSRLYPLYLLSLLFSAQDFFHSALNLGEKVPFFAWPGQHLGLAIFLVLVMCQAWVPLAALAWNPPAWFLSALIFFYAIFPILLAWFKRIPTRYLFTIGIAAWLIAQGTALLYIITSPDGVATTDSTMDTLPWLNAVKFNPMVRLPEFIMGMVFGLWFSRHREKSTLATPLVLCGIALVIVTIALNRSIPYVMLHTGFLAPAVAMLILGLAFRPAWTGPLEWRIPILLGESSYALYLLHGPILVKWLFIDFEPPSTTTPGYVLTGITITIAASILAFQLIEKRAKNWMSSRLLRHEKAKHPITAL